MGALYDGRRRRSGAALASSMQAEERLGLARAVVFRVVSSIGEPRRPTRGDGGPLRKPVDLELDGCPREAEELSEKIGKAAAALTRSKPGTGSG